MESEALDVERFVPLLRSHMAIVNPYVRQLLVGWITALDTAPGVHMLDHLSELLEGLFSMLSDGNREIRQQAYAALSTFLDQIGKISAADFESRVAFRPMVDTLIAQTGTAPCCSVTALAPAYPLTSRVLQGESATSSIV